MAIRQQLLKLALLAFLTAATSQSFANEAGNVIRAKGQVNAGPIPEDTLTGGRELAAGDPIMEGEAIVTGAGGGVQLQMKDGAIIALAPDTHMNIIHYKYGASSEEIEMAVLKGRFRTISGDTNKENYVLTTPVALVRILGTTFDVRVEDDSKIVLREGAISAQPICGGTPSGDATVVDVPNMAVTISSDCEELTVEEDVEEDPALNEFLPVESSSLEESFFPEPTAEPPPGCDSCVTDPPPPGGGPGPDPISP
jgi:ferric-dicitrate binding protein FerR (iron transport regulator)